MDHKHIVAFGGLRVRPGAMSPVIDYILSLPQEILHLPQKPRPRICMIPTATGDSPASLLAFYNSVPGHGPPALTSPYSIAPCRTYAASSSTKTSSWWAAATRPT